MPKQPNPWLASRTRTGSEYDAPYEARAAAGLDVHGEASLVEKLLQSDLNRSGSAPPYRVLDAGCGTGRMAIELHRRGAAVTGVDLDEVMLTQARAKAPDLDWRLGDLSTIELDGAFDAIVLAGNVMIYLTPGTEAATLANLARYLRPGGLLVAGFELTPKSWTSLTLEAYDRVAAAAGLSLAARWSTWDQAPWSAWRHLRCVGPQHLMPDAYLPGRHPRARWMRLDAAALLKRFFYLEQSLVVSQAGWLPAVPLLDAKIGLPRHLWEDALTAGALRERVLELRFPNRLMEAGDDAPLISLFEAGRHAPSAEAFVLSLAQVFKPALLAGYQLYLAQADEIADGPTLRILRQAVQDKSEQIRELESWAANRLAAAPAGGGRAEAWTAGLQAQFTQLGGVSLGPLEPGLKLSPLPGAREFAVAETPARDGRFYRSRFYWPDNFDPSFPYGQGVQLQMRSALSHLNEIWAVETAGAILYAFADRLGWEFVLDAARWCYDESRHCRMGYERLREWGFQLAELPLGSYIYDSGRGRDPLYRLGMLSFFETKNIGRKTERIKAFHEYQDSMSQHDMDYDWADETIHAHYGQHWLTTLIESGYAGAAGLDVDAIRAQCSELVAATIATATAAERAELRQLADTLLAKAEGLAAAHQASVV